MLTTLGDDVVGEAKRRKAAGTYPNGSEDVFTVADGMVAITMDVDDAIVPVTVEFDAGILADLADKPEMPMADAATDRPCTYEEMCRTIQLYIQSGCMKTRDDTARMALFALWSTLHPPKDAATFRRKLSERLRIDGSVHITWHMSRGGLVFTADDKPVNLRHVEPSGTGVLFEREAQPEPPAN